MPVVEESVVIKRPPSEVFAEMLNLDNIPLWNSNVLGYEVVSGTLGQEDAEVRVKMNVLGRTIEGVGEPIEVEEGRRVKSRFVSPITLELETHWEDTDGGTRLTQRQTFEAPEGFFGDLDDELVARLYATDLRSNLEKLKVLLEGG